MTAPRPATKNGQVVDLDRPAQPGAAATARPAEGGRATGDDKPSRRKAKAAAAKGRKALDAKRNGHGKRAGQARAASSNVDGHHQPNGRAARSPAPVREPARRDGEASGRATAQRPALAGAPAAGRVETGAPSAPGGPPDDDRSARRRRRAAKREERILRDSPAARRAELVAAAAAAAAAAEQPPAARAPIHGAHVARRLAAFVAILTLPASVAALLMVRAPVTTLARGDASVMSAELIAADQRVRTGLARLSRLGTTPALDRTRDAISTTRSLELEIRHDRGAEAQRLQRALRLEASWLEAVGSTLSNPRSPLRDELAARDGAVRAALVALPGPAGSRTGGARHLSDYARSRIEATRNGGARTS